MKKLFGFMAAVAISGLVAGCSTPPRHAILVSPTGEIFVPESPPAPKTEVRGSAPAEGYNWIPGYWTYQNTHWVWVSGHWENPPQSGQTWVSGHWDRTSRGWVWTPGHWE